MGMEVDEFYKMRLSHFFVKLHGWSNNQQRIFRERAELVRLQTVELINIQLKSANKLKSPDKLWQFPWDTENKPSLPLVEETEAKEQLERVLKLLANE